MTFFQWFLLFLVIQIIHFLGTYKLYRKAGRHSWEATIPIYNAIVLMKIINRPWWWTILFFIPVVNLIMFPVIWVETVRSFGKHSVLDTWLAILTFGFYIYYLNYFLNVSYIKDRSLKPRTSVGEWVSSILFAIIAATIVHTYFIQPYTIPSSSLEKTLLVGDFLLVSKINYGARIPMTTIAAPMVHDTIPGLGKSYLFNDEKEEKNSSWMNKFQFPYLRFPGLEKIKRNDLVVFNQPADTLLDMNDFSPDRNYYKPVDKKTNLVKRAVGIPGDSLEIKAGYIYINGNRTVLPDRAKPQYNFFVNTQGQAIDQRLLKERYGARDGLKYPNGNFALNQNGGYILTLTDSEADLIRKHPVVKDVKKSLSNPGEAQSVFPYIDSLSWNLDNYGPIYIPKKGAIVNLDRKTLPFYKRVITEYEGNQLEVKNNKIFINGLQTDKYTFKQDYYWMMGDNRQNSLDARKWGFVPFDHVVGKPVFIWLSINQDGEGFDKIRWDRMFTTVGGEGKPNSYLLPFILILLLIFGFGKYHKQKRK
ncbi:signal peptidase I [Salegentibacter sp. 24]|uniref:signal peptidase I n=1 Tax=Salegentibacter sp. 24 TaxID=2183986 RepID=UPI00105B5053|nr:signal peptidase I [Salegentibacter sp. 24]TDN80375.1 signal peptidase I [Salegentibacter sp. 24]